MNNIKYILFMYFFFFFLLISRFIFIYTYYAWLHLLMHQNAS